MKLFYRFACVLFFAAITVSCSNDDDVITPDNNAEKIIGTWQFSEIKEDGIPLELGPCLPQSTVEFKIDHRFTTNSFSESFSGEGEDCVEEVHTGQWEYRGNNQFMTIIDGEEDSEELIFSDNGNVFSSTETQDNGSVEVVSFIKID